jgi:hypothetical protein
MEDRLIGCTQRKQNAADKQVDSVRVSEVM